MFWDLAKNDVILGDVFLGHACKIKNNFHLWLKKIFVYRRRRAQAGAYRRRLAQSGADRRRPDIFSVTSQKTVRRQCTNEENTWVDGQNVRARHVKIADEISRDYDKTSGLGAKPLKMREERREVWTMPRKFAPPTRKKISLL